MALRIGECLLRQIMQMSRSSKITVFYFTIISLALLFWLWRWNDGLEQPGNIYRQSFVLKSTKAVDLALEQIRERSIQISNLTFDNGDRFQEMPAAADDYLESSTKSLLSTTSSLSTTFSLTETTRQQPPKLDPVIQSAIDALQSVLDHPFSKKARAGQVASLHNYGLQTRLDRILMKLLLPTYENSKEIRRKKLRIGAVGGSITVGNGIPKGEAYFDHFNSWIAEPLGRIGIDTTFQNAAMGAFGSESFAMCIDEYFDLSQIDVMFVEFAFNDGRYVFYMSGYRPNGGRPLEELVRTIWRRNPMIHIILVNFPFIKNIFTLYFPPNCEGLEEVDYLKVAQHYQITSIQWKHMFCNPNGSSTLKTKAQQARLAEIYVAEDGNHPSSLVHKQTAEFLIAYLKKSISRLIERLQMARGDSVARAMMSADKVTVKDQVARLLDTKSATVFNTTWIDASDCFVGYERPFGTNWKLSNSMVNSSKGVDLNSFFTIDVYEQNGYLYGDNLQLIILQNKFSFASFLLRNLRQSSPCQNGASFEPRLAFAYTLCKNCSPGSLSVKASIVLSNTSVYYSDFQIKLYSHGFKTNYVHMLPTMSQMIRGANATEGNNDVDTSNPNATTSFNMSDSVFCRDDESPPLIDAVRLDIEQTSHNYPLLLHGIALNYDCCMSP